MGFEPVIPISTIWDIEIVRAGKILNSWRQRNVLTDQGLNHVLNAVFHGGTQITQWYMVLFNNDFTPLVTNTYAIPGYTESTGYSEPTRPPWVEGPASDGIITNTLNRSEFTMSVAETVYGLALVGGGYGPSIKNDKDELAPVDATNLGVLFCASKFPSSQALDAFDIVRASCTIILEGL